MSNSIKETIRHNCPMRHENGNCLVAGGFCTAVNTHICEALHNAYNAGETHAMEEMKKQGYRKQSEGEWIWKTKVEAQAQNRKYCSVCDEECPSKNNYYLHPKFCPNCGAKMKGGVE